MGGALVQYHGFRQRGFHITAIYDQDAANWVALERPRRARRQTSRIRPQERSERHRHRRNAREAAQQVVDRLVRSGVKAILNFAPVP